MDSVPLEQGDRIYVLGGDDIADVILIEICTKKEACGRRIDGKTGQAMGNRAEMIRLRRNTKGGITTLAPKYSWGYGHYVYTRETAKLKKIWNTQWLRVKIWDELRDIRDRVGDMSLKQLRTLDRQLELKANFGQEK